LTEPSHYSKTNNNSTLRRARLGLLGQVKWQYVRCSLEDPTDKTPCRYAYGKNRRWHRTATEQEQTLASYCYRTRTDACIVLLRTRQTIAPIRLRSKTRPTRPTDRPTSWLVAEPDDQYDYLYSTQLYRCAYGRTRQRSRRYACDPRPDRPTDRPTKRPTDWLASSRTRRSIQRYGKIRLQLKIVREESTLRTGT